MGAALPVVLLDQVDLLVFRGLCFVATGTTSAVLACTGAGRACTGWLCSGTGGAVSLAPRDFLNQREVLVAKGWPDSGESLVLRVDGLRPRSLWVLLLLGRMSGSTASEKYSCSKACLEVGRTFGSHRPAGTGSQAGTQPKPRVRYHLRFILPCQ